MNEQNTQTNDAQKKTWYQNLKGLFRRETQSKSLEYPEFAFLTWHNFYRLMVIVAIVFLISTLMVMIGRYRQTSNTRASRIDSRQIVVVNNYNYNYDMLETSRRIPGPWWGKLVYNGLTVVFEFVTWILFYVGGLVEQKHNYFNAVASYVSIGHLYKRYTESPNQERLQHLSSRTMLAEGLPYTSTGTVNEVQTEDSPRKKAIDNYINQDGAVIAAQSKLTQLRPDYQNSVADAVKQGLSLTRESYDLKSELDIKQRQLNELNNYKTNTTALDLAKQQATLQKQISSLTEELKAIRVQEKGGTNQSFDFDYIIKHQDISNYDPWETMGTHSVKKFNETNLWTSYITYLHQLKRAKQEARNTYMVQWLERHEVLEANNPLVEETKAAIYGFDIVKKWLEVAHPGYRQMDQDKPILQASSEKPLVYNLKTLDKTILAPAKSQEVVQYMHSQVGLNAVVQTSYWLGYIVERARLQVLFDRYGHSYLSQVMGDDSSLLSKEEQTFTRLIVDMMTGTAEHRTALLARLNTMCSASSVGITVVVSNLPDAELEMLRQISQARQKELVQFKYAKGQDLAPGATDHGTTEESQFTKDAKSWDQAHKRLDQAVDEYQKNHPECKKLWQLHQLKELHQALGKDLSTFHWFSDYGQATIATLLVLAIGWIIYIIADRLYKVIMYNALTLWGGDLMRVYTKSNPTIYEQILRALSLAFGWILLAWTITAFFKWALAWVISLISVPNLLFGTWVSLGLVLGIAFLIFPISNILEYYYSLVNEKVTSTKSTSTSQTGVRKPISKQAETNKALKKPIRKQTSRPERVRTQISQKPVSSARLQKKPSTTPVQATRKVSTQVKTNKLVSRPR